jgi:hypothetical protein
MPASLRGVHLINGMGIVPMEVWPAEDVLNDVRHAAALMHAGVVCLLGGEPTSHPKLVEIMRGVRDLDLGDRIQVLTNGMRLHRMKPEFWAEVDELKISIYPGKTQPENVELAKAMQAEHGFHLDFYDVADDPFRAVLTDRERTPEEAQQVYDGCWYRTYTRKIERGHLWRCCTSPSISQTILGLAPDVDGIRLEGLGEKALREFLSRPEPARSCSRCYGNLGPRIEQWSEERRGHDEWVAASTVPLPMLVEA